MLYVKENDNLERVLEAVEQLNTVRLGYVTTERILFICEQSNLSEVNTMNRDETMNQSENNMKAYAGMFNQLDEGVAHHE